MNYWVYIIECADKSYYNGLTANLTKRINEHRLGLTPFTKNKMPILLVYKQKFETRIDAAKREKEIKGWRREKKELLIRSLR